MTTARVFVAGIVGALAWPCVAQAGSVTAEGNVTALTHIDQMGPILGTAHFDEGPVNGAVPLDAYAAQGMTFHVGALSQILPGVITPGNASQPQYRADCATYFPAPQNGGACTAQHNVHAGVVTFSVDVTQVGLTASRNGTQYLTAWDKNGVMLGQVKWTPNSDSSFIGIDTQGVPIGLLSYGNDDLWNGETYSIGGATIFSDTWVWSAGPGCQNDAACDDNDACNGVETCVNGECQPGEAPDCDDDNPCTDDACDALLGCTHVDNADPCDDGDACTENDVCAGGTCSGGAPVDCSDGNLCTEDSCDPNTGCQNQPIGGCCLDDLGCGVDEVCDLDTNTCVPVGGTTGTTGDTDTAGTTDDTGTTGDTSTTDDTSGGVMTGTGSTTDEPTTGAPTTGTSGGASGTGESTSGAPTTGAPGGTTSGTSTGTTDDGATTGSGIDDGGCSCDARGRGLGDVGALLVLLGLA
ncbi:MAG TPA: hypothetical protein VIK91_04525, partial [Nannocystis sp.]